MRNWTIKSCGKAHNYCKVCDPEHSNKIANATRNRTKEELIRQAAWRKGKPRSQECKNKISNKLKGQKLNSETRAKISAKVITAMMEGRFKPENHRITRRVQYKNIWFRSRWESSFARWLDSKNIKWIYEPKRFKISIGTYLPDFFLPEKNTWIEVKGRHIGLDKVECFRREYRIKIILADGDYFKRKGIPIK